MKTTAVQVKPHNLINRKYQAVKKSRNIFWTAAAVNLAFAASDAIAHKGFMTILMGSAGLFSLKCVESAINILLTLKTQYKEIVERAKNINKIRSLNETV